MPRDAGTKLGPYEILAPIGAGGMGEVYKARDTRLDRTVAIKVLPEHLSENTELRQRFEQEARAVSSLNHPHICTLHDVGHEDGIDFLVMEYIEGETLADLLEKGPLPLERALTYGIQICDALDKAHRGGVVHRDLKPGNIIISRTGAKLLDFGLAKLQPSTGDGLDLSGVTQQKPLTQQGAILGTFQYMAPEQLEGGEADARTDLFAFGAVLYEMVTGKKAFEGKSQASLIHAIMGVDPAPVSIVSPTSPAALDHVIQSCLAKEPDDRSQSAGEVGRNLKWIRSAGGEAAAPVVAASSSRWERLAWVGALAIAVIAVWALTRPAPPRVARLVVTPPAAEPLEITGSHADVAFTPDGSRIIYTATPGRVLFVRPVDRLEATPLRNTASGRSPFVSADGAWIGFMSNADNAMKKISLQGGPAVTITEIEESPRGASWGEDDTIVFAPSPVGGLFRVPASGGEPERLTQPENNVAHLFPAFLPGAQAVLFTVVSGRVADTAQIAVLDLATGKHVTLAPGTSPRYVDSGHVVYAHESTLLAAPFDLRSLSLTGSPVPVVEDVDTKGTGAGNFALSRDGSLVYVPGDQASRERVFVWDHRSGEQEPISVPSGRYGAPRISPDGTRVAFHDNGGDRDIWIWDFERATATRLTFDPEADVFPVWTPDGKRVIFESNRNGKASLHARAADGTSEVERLTDEDGRPRSVSPDGKLLVYSGSGSELDLYVLSLEEGTSQPLVVDDGVQVGATISPNGRWLAYASNESGNFEIYVRPFPNVEAGRWMISTGSGEYPTWGPDNREIFYFDEESSRVRVVDVEPGPAFTPGRSLPVPYEPNFMTVRSQNYDVHPDGEKFLSLRDVASEADGTQRHFVVVLNWAEELKRLVP